MAKKKKSSSRRARYKRIKSKPQSTMGKAMRYVSPVAYGYFRDKISDAVMNSSIGKQLPVTNFTDEGLMLALGYGAKMLGLTKNKTVSQVVTHSRTIELNNIGRTLSDLQQSKAGSMNNTAQSAYVYN